MTDVVEQLKARIDQLEEQQESLRKRLAEVQLDQWQGRIDDLDVQAHLGASELRDRLEPIVKRAQDELATVREQMAAGTETASQATTAVRTGVEQAFDDLRTALRQAKDIIIG